MGERQTDRERNFDWLPPLCTLAGDQICPLLVKGWHSNPRGDPSRALKLGGLFEVSVEENVPE